MLGHKAHLPVFAAVLSVCAAPAALAGSSSPSSLLASIVKAGNSQQSAHEVSVGVSVYAKVGMVSDAGRDEGIQRSTFTQAGKTGHVTVIATAAAAYARGDAFTLARYMEFKPAAAKKYAGVWIKFVKGGTGFSSVGAGVLLSSTMDELKPSAPLTLLPAAAVGGQRVVGVRGRTPPSSGVNEALTLYARAAGSPLPVEEHATAGGKVRFRVTFSNWNEPLHVAIPTSTVPVSVVLNTP